MATADIELAGRRVLVIEDEWMVAALIEDTLVDIGCEVIGSASRFEDALEKAKALSFDLAVLDINLDGEQTFPIAEALRERGAAYLFATGYGANNLPEPFRQVPVLKKPFLRQDMERALRMALAG